MKQDIGPPILEVSPLGYLLSGTVLLVLAGAFFVSLNEDPAIVMVFSMLAAGPGLYLLITGAVARGIQVARESG